MNTPVTIKVPGSKSLSHRAVICAALAGGESVLDNVLLSDDVLRTIGILRTCGASIELADNGRCRIKGLGGPPGHLGAPLDCFAGESGSTLRLLAAVLAAGQGAFLLHGLPGLHLRPVDEVLAPLRDLGATITCPDGREGFSPLLIESSGLRTASVSGMKNSASAGLAGDEVLVSCDKTSQALSGLLLASPYVRTMANTSIATVSVDSAVSSPDCAARTMSGLCIRLGGQAPVSWPYVELTLQVMACFGVRVSEASRQEGVVALSRAERAHFREEPEFTSGDERPAIASTPAGSGGRAKSLYVPSGAYKPASFALEGDWSSASYFLAAGVIGPRPVRVLGLDPASRQGDRAMLDILRSMGARINLEADAVVAAPGPLHGIDCDMNACPDLVPTVLALAAHAQGESRVRGVAHLRFKESDRAAALVSELTRAGCLVRMEAGGADIVLTPPEGGPLPAARREAFRTYGDHRLAMAFSLLGLNPSGASVRVRLDNYECVKKSFPGFWAEWEKLF